MTISFGAGAVAKVKLGTICSPPLAATGLRLAVTVYGRNGAPQRPLTLTLSNTSHGPQKVDHHISLKQLLRRRYWQAGPWPQCHSSLDSPPKARK
jgi:hypothetical protein